MRQFCEDAHLTDSTEQEVALITAALNHAWERFTFRVTSALQILNYYILAVAILAGDYVGALTQGLPGIAASIGLGGSVACPALVIGGGFVVGVAGGFAGSIVGGWIGESVGLGQPQVILMHPGSELRD
jgi:hypothetical protein